jgi:sulfonate transport system substrate-binding protein
MHKQSTATSSRSGLRRTGVLVCAVLVSVVVTACGSSSSGSTTTTGASSGTTAPLDLSGVTINFADQFKEYQTAFTATNTLAGAPYKVDYSEFIGGPPIITAESGGSVDLGDMAETPTIFAQAANDPVKVVAATVGADPSESPFGLVVPKGSPITSVSQLRGKTIAVQEGTVEQYVLIQMLKKADIPYSAVTVDNLAVTNASTAVASGKVDAAVLTQPLIALDVYAGTATQVVSAAAYAKTLGYLTASQAALDNPEKAAAIADFINRFYKAEAILRKNPMLAAETYVKTYDVPLAVAEAAVKTVQAVGTPITPAIISYQQQEADTFHQLGLVPTKLDVSKIFDLPYNQKVSQAAGLTS